MKTEKKKYRKEQIAAAKTLQDFCHFFILDAEGTKVLDGGKLELSSYTREVIKNAITADGIDELSPLLQAVISKSCVYDK